MPDLTNHAFAIVDEDVTIWVTDHVVKVDGTDLLPSDVDKWSLWVFDARNAVLGKEVYSLLDQPPTSPPFFTSMQPPGGYSNKPYNFRQPVPGTAWDQIGGLRYLIVVRIYTLGGSLGVIPLNRTIQIKGSPL